MRKRGRPPCPDVLTPRESEVLELVRQGLTNEQISQRLGVSPNGVKYHMAQILSKLGVGSRAEAAAWRPDSKPWWASAMVLVGWPLKHLSWSAGVKVVASAGLVAATAGTGMLVWWAVDNGDIEEVAFVAQEGSSAPDLVIERASAAAQEVTSFHFTMSVTLSVEEAGEIDVAEGEGDYLAPDRVWVRGMPGEEQIIIGRNLYRRGSESSEWRVGEIPEGTPPGMGYASMMDPQANLEFLTSPDEGVVWLPDEVIDGVDTWHYRRTVDIAEGWIERMEAETDPGEKEWWQEVIDLTREAETTLEFETWIGKEDYLVRQTRSVQSVKALSSDHLFDIAIPEGATYTITWTMKLSKFDEPVKIEAPF